LDGLAAESGAHESADYSRRGFVKGAVAAISGVAALGLGACAATDNSSYSGGSEDSRPWLPEAWDDEADVVVIGYGGAGACAATAASDAGASVLVLEKAPTAEGGNTACSTGTIHTTIDANDVNEHIQKITNGCFGTTPSAAAIRAVAEGMKASKQWLLDHDVPIIKTSEQRSTAQRPAGNNWAVDKGDGTNGEGTYLFAALDEMTKATGTRFMFSTPAKRLIQDPITRDILGVEAQTQAGPVLIKANKGVVMACGGYENNPLKQGWYNYPGLRLWPWGTPYNTGDGLDMASAVGASIWHMHGLEWAAVNFRKPTEEVGCSVGTDATSGIVPANYFFVNKTGKRFMNDARGMGHDVAHKPVTDFNDTAVEYYNIPFWMVFDDALFDAAPLYRGTGRTNIVNTYAGIMKLCDWGPDNTKALQKGWIVQATSIRELAAKMSSVDPNGRTVTVDADGLEATLNDYNGYAAAGSDPDFSRDPAKLLPLNGPNFYAIELGLTTINTQGGPEHDEYCRSMHVDGTPIPRLYNVGEFGSINGYVYVAGNLAEAITTGRIAGDHAAKLDPWV
jgi:succinate dehydrogenase/fumarate reductase flavoprotein subunit